MIGRREFLTFLGGTAAWPLAARAQQPAKLRIIGFLGPGTPSAWSAWTAAFVQRLRELGWIEGRTLAIEYRWAAIRSELVQQAIVRRPAHPRRLVGVLVIGRVAAARSDMRLLYFWKK
jgi:hypothetical protein